MREELENLKLAVEKGKKKKKPKKKKKKVTLDLSLPPTHPCPFPGSFLLCN